MTFGLALSMFLGVILGNIIVETARYGWRSHKKKRLKAATDALPTNGPYRTATNGVDYSTTVRPRTLPLPKMKCPACGHSSSFNGRFKSPHTYNLVTEDLDQAGLKCSLEIDHVHRYCYGCGTDWVERPAEEVGTS